MPSLSQRQSAAGIATKPPPWWGVVLAPMVLEGVAPLEDTLSKLAVKFSGPYQMRSPEPPEGHDLVR